MTKKTATANKAIDFARLFAVKDQVARQAAEDSIVADAGVHASEGQGSVQELPRPFLVEPDQVPESSSVLRAPVVEGADDSPSEVVSSLLRKRTSRKAPLVTVEDAPDSTIRVGMPRELHDRVRACAALQGAAPTLFAREVLEQSTPIFDAKAPLAELARKARSVVKVGMGGPRRVDVRMQIPVTEDLHQRLIQLAALRTQTLGTCLLDILEHHVPAM